MKRLPLAFGVLTATSLSIAWILYVSHLVDTATIPGDDRHWLDRARYEAYGICYNGCSDCLDVSSIEDACQMTARAQVPGVKCDATRMWLWTDRYPTECLEAVGDLFKDQELKRKRSKLRFLYTLLVLTLFSGFAAYEAAGRFIVWIQKQQRRRERYPPRVGPRASATTPLLRATTISTALIGIVLCAGPVNGYGCMNWHPVHNQPFVSKTDPTLFGNIHGWMSDCYSESYDCGEDCDSDNNESTTCTTAWCSRERPGASPGDFVRKASKLVTTCGFEMVDIVPGIVDKRIANPKIEGDLWVKVSVNRFNSSDGVIGQVLCLGDIVKWPSVRPVRSSRNLYSSILGFLGYK